MFQDGSRIIFRLSGTGSVGATVRIYFEKYESDPAKMLLKTEDALADIIKIGLDLCQIQKFTGRE